MTALKMNPTQMALQMIHAIRKDMEAGTVPTSVTSFAELHDYVDANEYLIDAIDGADEVHDASDDDQAQRDNAAMALVNEWLEVMIVTVDPAPVGSRVMISRDVFPHRYAETLWTVEHRRNREDGTPVAHLVSTTDARAGKLSMRRLDSVPVEALTRI